MTELPLVFTFNCINYGDVSLKQRDADQLIVDKLDAEIARLKALADLVLTPAESHCLFSKIAEALSKDEYYTLVAKLNKQSEEGI